ncbi:hypothetical protein [Pseudomonas sp. HN2-3]|uniref:phosphoribosyltransferase-like protein n=1 Tax=unclassified Pseudomonas TaxID=196821 RepID=UPI001D109BEA|nr:hypothetical protein [Pseudomonas sp. HN2-3]UDU81630.1 hypothetical protein LJX93_01305 [Pseudomonas sp. HN2-3]
MDVPPTDNTKLKEIIRKLCATKIRNPLTMERVRTWLKQFKSQEEQTLALLIVKNLIFRNSAQIESSLRQALKEAALHFEPPEKSEAGYNWKEILSNKKPLRSNRYFYFAPPIMTEGTTPPGKSGELIARSLHSNFGIDKSYQTYCNSRKLPEDEYLLIVDDGSFSGSQISQTLVQCGDLMRNHERGGIVLAIAHEEAIKRLAKDFPNVKVFYGELLTEKDNFKKVCELWIENKIWPYDKVDPYDLYLKTLARADMSDAGMGGLMVVYEHGIPDNTLPLLWKRSANWEPLFER